MAALPRSAAASAVPSLSSPASTSVSIRLTKNDATERIWDRPAGFGYISPRASPIPLWPFRGDLIDHLAGYGSGVGHEDRPLGQTPG
jgi:hypothetical protein